MDDEGQHLTVNDDGTPGLTGATSSSQPDMIHNLTVQNPEQTLLATIQNQSAGTGQSPSDSAVTAVISNPDVASAHLMQLASLGITPQQQQQIIMAAQRQVLQQIQAGLSAGNASQESSTSRCVSRSLATVWLPAIYGVSLWCVYALHECGQNTGWVWIHS